MYCSQALNEVVEQTGHCLVYLLVVECLCVVLKYEAYCIALLAGFEVLAFVNIEEGYILKQFLLCLAGNLLYLCEGIVKVEAMGDTLELQAGESVMIRDVNCEICASSEAPAVLMKAQIWK